jgi:pSer/pThr/pTyr-binding forkhead associated (FHA) protein
MDAKLRVVQGPFAGETIRVPRGKLLIGREKDCQLRLDSKSVSPHHCVLLLDDYTLRIRDLGSKHGTIVNGNRIGTHEAILLHDDKVSIDQLTFHIDLSQTADGVVIAAAEAEPFVGPNALDETGIIEGDTAQTVPTEAVRHSSARLSSQEDPSGPQAAPTARPRVNLQCAAPISSKRRRATSSLTTVSSPRAIPRNDQRNDVTGPAVALPSRSEQPVTKPKQIVKAKPGAAGKVERPAKKSSVSGVRTKMAIAGLTALVGFVGGGMFLLRGPSQGTPYEVPQKYVLFNPKIYATMMSCEVPEDWKQQIRGGQNIGPIVARFTDGRLSIEICENLTVDGIREVVVAMRQKADTARRDASPAELIHEHQRQQASESFKSYNEEPQSRGIKTKGFGESRVSDFTATEGIFGTEVRGCRATAANQARQFTVTCKCPPSLFQAAKPVFEKVVSSLNCGMVALK